ncbi:hypothetical protein CTAYLR_008197 [Chrysophaeum taylorii]|uniref:HAT C-terminal dimerisation domain-containing protein n=1 Tax=Chrysophaeum taylorii TaxID=2483200 RepID=A0AAD7XKF2_9STRA|nr:hypothetical protein CTAYLR_008197 [Chrysophaeum taylorii]
MGGSGKKPAASKKLASVSKLTVTPDLEGRFKTYVRCGQKILVPGGWWDPSTVPGSARKKKDTATIIDFDPRHPVIQGRKNNPPGIKTMAMAKFTLENQEGRGDENLQWESVAVVETWARDFNKTAERAELLSKAQQHLASNPGLHRRIEGAAAATEEISTLSTAASFFELIEPHVKQQVCRNGEEGSWKWGYRCVLDLKPKKTVYWTWGGTKDKPGSSTKEFFRYLKRDFPDVYSAYVEQTQTSITTGADGQIVKRYTLEAAWSFHVDCAVWMAKDMRALMLGSTKAARNFFGKLDPRYRAPSRPTLNLILHSIFEVLRGHLVKLVSTVREEVRGPYASAGMDIWTVENVSRSFVAITLKIVQLGKMDVSYTVEELREARHSGDEEKYARMIENPTYVTDTAKTEEFLIAFDSFDDNEHTGKNILHFTVKALKEVNVRLDDLVKIVLDGAANGRLAMRLAGIVARWCTPHILALVESDVEKDVPEYAAHMKALRTRHAAVRGSTKAQNCFKKLQIDAGVKAYQTLSVLGGRNLTRWGGDLRMLRLDNITASFMNRTVNRHFPGVYARAAAEYDVDLELEEEIGDLRTVVIEDIEDALPPRVVHADDDDQDGAAVVVARAAEGAAGDWDDVEMADTAEPEVPPKTTMRRKYLSNTTDSTKSPHYRNPDLKQEDRQVEAFLDPLGEVTNKTQAHKSDTIKGVVEPHRVYRLTIQLRNHYKRGTLVLPKLDERDRTKRLNHDELVNTTQTGMVPMIKKMLEAAVKSIDRRVSCPDSNVLMCAMLDVGFSWTSATRTIDSEERPIFSAADKDKAEKIYSQEFEKYADLLHDAEKAAWKRQQDEHLAQFAVARGGVNKGTAPSPSKRGTKRRSTKEENEDAVVVVDGPDEDDHAGRPTTTTATTPPPATEPFVLPASKYNNDARHKEKTAFANLKLNTGAFRQFKKKKSGVDMFAFLAAFKDEYPIHAALLRAHLSAPMTEADVESIFSHAGRAVGKLRNRLGSELLRAIMFIAMNSDKLPWTYDEIGISNSPNRGWFQPRAQPAHHLEAGQSLLMRDVGEFKQESIDW